MTGPTIQHAKDSGPAALVLALLGLGVIVLLTVVVMLIRRKLLSEQPASGGPASLIEEFRRMRASGQMSEDEFEAARARLAARVQTGMGVSKLAPKSIARRAPGTESAPPRTPNQTPPASPPSSPPEPPTPQTPARPPMHRPQRPPASGGDRGGDLSSGIPLAPPKPDR